MKKITLGIAILLFAIVLALCSSGMDWLILIVGVTGLLFSIQTEEEKIRVRLIVNDTLKLSP